VKAQARNRGRARRCRCFEGQGEGLREESIRAAVRIAPLIPGLAAVRETEKAFAPVASVALRDRAQYHKLYLWARDGRNLVVFYYNRVRVDRGA